ncbi:MAG TPA: hypothetical protein VKQ72_02770, partial [Aggregatilineales bacterium]|nr:hypothetical protein [Aggregatilineales bacterium]
LALLCAYSLERLRRGIDRRQIHPGWLMSSLAAFVAAYFAKQAVFLLLPMYIVIAFPTVAGETLRRRAGVIISLIVTFVLLLIALRFLPNYQRRADIDLSFLPIALPAYLFSPGFSLWAFSPILLLGLGGAILLIQQRRYRELIVPLIVLLSVTIGYTVIQRENWYGGVGWGPRYLLPLTPFMTLWLLPVFERLLERKLSRWATALTVGVTVLSVLIQVVAVSISTTTFSDYLSFESTNLGRPSNDPIAEWRDGAWNPLYIPGVVMAQQARTVDPGFAWASTGSGAIVIPLCLLVVVAGLAMLRGTQQSWRKTLPFGALALATLCLCLYVGLRAYAADPFYTGNYSQALQALERLKGLTQPGDAIILNDSFYRRIFMNYYRGNTPVYELSDAPGERLGANPTPEVITDNPEGQAPPAETLVLARLASTSSRWWFVTEFGPYSQGRLRPTEKFLDRHYFPVQEVMSSSDLRVIEYAPIPAPPDGVPPWPSDKIGADFGAVYLIGDDISSKQVKAGNILPVSLLWRHDQWPIGLQPFDYSVNVSLVSPAGNVVAQRAGPPVGGFGQISQWASGSYYRDNHALALPSDLAPGEYELWVVVYNWQDNSRLPIRNMPGNSEDHVVIAHIQVAP